MIAPRASTRLGAQARPHGQSMTESLVSVDAVPRRRVLVIDDEAHHRVLVSELLEGEGFDVLAASDGKEGLRHARDWRPDVILCDLLMPGMSGGDFIRAYRASPRRTPPCCSGPPWACPHDPTSCNWMRIGSSTSRSAWTSCSR